jgi:hypothetical protein
VRGRPIGCTIDDARQPHRGQSVVHRSQLGFQATRLDRVDREQARRGVGRDGPGGIDGDQSGRQEPVE